MFTSSAVQAQQFMGTPVQANPMGIPTLTYNCAKMPSICQNVNSQNPLQPTQGGFGPVQGQNNYVTLHYDRQAGSPRAAQRRCQACPNSRCPGNPVPWKSTHACPEPQQPLVVPEPFNKGGRTLSR